MPHWLYPTAKAGLEGIIFGAYHLKIGNGQDTSYQGITFKKSRYGYGLSSRRSGKFITLDCWIRLEFNKAREWTIFGVIDELDSSRSYFLVRDLLARWRDFILVCDEFSELRSLASIYSGFIRVGQVGRWAGRVLMDFKTTALLLH